MIIRDAWRALRSAPGSTAFSLLILSSAIAAATVTFSVVDAVILRSLPYEDSDQLVMVGADPSSVQSEVNFTAWRDQADAFSAVAATSVGPMAHVPSDSGVEYVRAWRTTASLFDVLRVTPLKGRVFTAVNETEAHAAVAVIGCDLWQRHFGGDPNVVGRSIRLANVRDIKEPAALVEIVGVMPKGFTYPMDASYQLWLPQIPETRMSAGSGYLRVIGRLRGNVTMQQAQAQIDVITTAVAAANSFRLPDGWRPPMLASFYDTLVGDVKGWMLLVLLAAGLVMLVACANIANLMLAQSARRARELAVRSSLGASARQLGTRLIAESLMLSLTAGALGVLLAYWGVGAAVAALPWHLPRADSIAVDLRVLLAAATAAIAAGLFFGVAPAWHAARVRPALLLGSGTPMVTPGYRRWRAGFVVGQVGFVAALLVVSALFVASFVRVAQADLGFSRSDLVAFELEGYEGEAATVTRVLRSTPGVASVAELRPGRAPLMMAAYGGARTSISLRAADDPNSAVSVRATVYEVSPEYFATVGTPVLRGRTFVDADVFEPVAIVDELAARVLFPDGQDPIGVRVSQGPSSRSYTVIGVVRTVSSDGPERVSGTQVYFPKDPSSSTSEYIVRTSGRAADVITALQASLRPVLPANVRVPSIRSLDEAFEKLTAGRRSNAQLMSIVGLVVLLIGTAGIYAVMTSVVAERQRELGVRMALGATRGRIIRGVLLRAGSYLVAGLVAGLLGGRALSGLIASLLFEVRPTDLSTYAVVAGLLLACGLIGALVPALRAARVDPIVALRQG